MKFFQEFFTFLKTYNIITLAIAFVVGLASTALINSFVKDLFMPALSFFVPADSLQAAAFEIGGAVFRYGSFLSEFLTFLLIVLVIFLLVRKFPNLKK